MTFNGSGQDALLVIPIQSEEEQVARIETILRQLNIPVDVVDRRPQGTGCDDITVRVPLERVVTALLALEQQGFKRIAAYSGQRGPS